MSLQTYTALLVDTVSIQSYIFGSNKLKENIGASYIIEHLLYGDILKQALKEAVGDEINLAAWNEHPDDIVIARDKNCRAEIGYIGGGNALILFKNKTDATKFVKEYSLSCLLHFPGLKTAIGKLNEFNPDEAEVKGFAHSQKDLIDALVLNKSLEYRSTSVPKPGIVKDCRFSNEAEEVNKKYEEGQLTGMSKLTWSKLLAAKEADKYINARYKDILGKDYAFTTNIEKFGQPEDKGYIAVVHVDGNGMGRRFMNCKSLVELRKLSKEVQRNAENTVEEFIRYVTSLYRNKILTEDNGFKLEQENGKRLLPLRPIISAGDDITFVCDGRLGVHLAETFISLFTREPLKGEPYHACAGIAIVKTKYPFYRAYHLAEDLIKKAKEPSRSENGSYLQFLISAGGFVGNNADDILRKKFSAKKGTLSYGPYRLDKPTGSIRHLKNGMRQLKTSWPQNKLKELRDVMRKGDSHIEYFLVAAKSRDLELPVINGKNYHSKIWDEGKTPYYDMIEMQHFYPEPLLKMEQ